MWDKQKLLLAVIVFTALYNKVPAKSAKQLDLAPYAVDDLYDGCHAQALEKFIHSGLLQQELQQSKDFQKAWSSNNKCSKPIPGKMKEHLAALLAYASGDEHFIEDFNNAVETKAFNVSTYENQFHFKSFHFLLMDSMTLLPQRECKTMYALPVEKFEATKGSRVKFGRFTKVQSSLSELHKMNDFDEQVLLNITSCFFANLGAYICSEDDAALLSPTEMFTVEDVKQVTDADESKYTVITLKHSQLLSSHNCFIFSRSPAGTSTQWLVLVLLALSLFLFNH